MATTKEALFLSTLLLLMGCAGSRPPPPEDIGQGPTFAKEYLIGIGDTLRVDVYRNEDLSATVPVRPDGRITVPVAGDIMVGGLTPEQVSKTIASALAAYVREPIVTTTVATLGSSDYLTRVRVTGAVNGVRSLPFRNGMTVLDLVLEAGGVNEFANPAKTTLYRGAETIHIRLDRILNRGDMSTNYTLRPGDVITVPARAF